MKTNNFKSNINPISQGIATDCPNTCALNSNDNNWWDLVETPEKTDPCQLKANIESEWISEKIYIDSLISSQSSIVSSPQSRCH